MHTYAYAIGKVSRLVRDAEPVRRRLNALPFDAKNATLVNGQSVLAGDGRWDDESRLLVGVPAGSGVIALVRSRP